MCRNVSANVYDSMDTLFEKSPAPVFNYDPNDVLWFDAIVLGCHLFEKASIRLKNGHMEYFATLSQAYTYLKRNNLSYIIHVPQE